MKIAEMLNRTAYSEARKEVNSLVRALMHVYENHKNVEHVAEYLPEIKALAERIEEHDISHLKEKPKALEGKPLERGDVRKLLHKTGFRNWTKWEVDPDNLNLDDIRETFGITLSKRQCRLFGYIRHTVDRSELMLLEFVCIPGFFQIDYSSDRIGSNTGWEKNEDLEKVIEQISGEF